MLKAAFPPWRPARSKPSGLRLFIAIGRLVAKAIPLVVLAFLVATVVSQWGELGRVEVRFDPVWLVGAFGALLGYQAIHGEVARIVLVELGQPIEGRRLRAIFSASLLARYVPTGALAVVARIGLQEREGVAKRVGTLGLLYETAIALVGAALLCLLLVARASVPLALGLLAVSPVAIALVLGPRFFPPLANRVLARLKREPVSRFLPTAAVLRLTLLCALSFVLAGVSVLCVVRGLTEPPAGSTATIIASAGLGFITSLLGFALPGGLGAREAGLTGALALVLPGPIAFAVAVVSRLVQTAVELTYAGVATLADRRRVPERPAAGTGT